MQTCHVDRTRKACMILIVSTDTDCDVFIVTSVWGVGVCWCACVCVLVLSRIYTSDCGLFMCWFCKCNVLPQDVIPFECRWKRRMGRVSNGDHVEPTLVKGTKKPPPMDFDPLSPPPPPPPRAPPSPSGTRPATNRKPRDPEKHGGWRL